MFDTLYLDPFAWDLVVDAFGNIAMASQPYAQAQDAASACRLWRGEAIYNTVRGMPYETEILGQRPPPGLLTGWYETEAKTVPDVATARAILQFDIPSRQLTGQIQLTLNDGTTTAIGL